MTDARSWGFHAGVRSVLGDGLSIAQGAGGGNGAVSPGRDEARGSCGRGQRFESSRAHWGLCAEGVPGSGKLFGDEPRSIILGLRIFAMQPCGTRVAAKDGSGGVFFVTEPTGYVLLATSTQARGMAMAT